MLLGIAPDARVFALDTHVLFPETYDVWRQVEKRYGIQVEVYQGPSLGRQAAIHGEALWERNPVALLLDPQGRPARHALAGLDGWITGVRREQSATRAGAAKLGWDERHELWQASPLADWTEAACRRLHRRARAAGQRAPRAAATPRSAARTAPSRERAARAAGPAIDKTECGLHVDA